MFYGQLIQDPEALKRMHHPLYGTFAGRDEGIPPDAVRKFVEALRAAGIQNDVHIYDDMAHGFWLYVDQDPKREAPALDAWTRLKAYLSRTLR
jgi:dienelactone hydrolase